MRKTVFENHLKELGLEINKYNMIIDEKIGNQFVFFIFKEERNWQIVMADDTKRKADAWVFEKESDAYDTLYNLIVAKFNEQKLLRG